MEKMRLNSVISLMLAAGLTVGCGQAGVFSAKLPPSMVRASVTGGKDLSLTLPPQSLLVVLELRSNLKAQALPATAASVVVSLTGDQLAEAFTQTISASQFVGNTAQVLLSGLNAGTYHLQADVKNAGGTVLVTGKMNVGVVAGKSTNASLVLIYGEAGTTGGLDGKIDYLALPLTISSMTIDPLIISGPGYPANIAVTTSHDAVGGLRFAYTTDGGTITGTGPNVVWMSPQGQGGTYTITVRVEDGIHAPANQSLSPVVTGGSQPVSAVVSFENFS